MIGKGTITNKSSSRARRSAAGTLVLGLGNDLLSDDAIGPVTARCLARRVGDAALVVASSLHGVALLDLIVGYERLIIIDAICDPRHRPGTIVELGLDDLRPVSMASPHYAGLPELKMLAERMGLRFPRQVQIIAVVVEDPRTIGGRMTLRVRRAMPALCQRVMDRLHEK